MVRIDKWLWAVRIFKSRSQATDICRKGKVFINNQSVKPSKSIKEQEIITIQNEGIKRIYKVLGLIDKRVSAKLAVKYVEDLTPPEEIEKLKIKREMRLYYHRFNDGKGKPTKKERRRIMRFRGKF